MKKEDFAKCEELWYQYKLQDTIMKLEEILEKDKEHVKANKKMAFIKYYYFQDYESALLYIHRAVKSQPMDAENHIIAGDIYHERGQYENAVICYEKALGLDCNNTDIYYSMAQAYSKLNKNHEARKILKEGNRINPCDERINTALHLQFIIDEDYRMAYDVWKDGNVCDTNSLGYFNKWNEVYKEALKNKADNKHAVLGNTFLQLLLYDEALIELKKALEDDPQNNDLKMKYYEISLFVKFRNELREAWYSYYQRRIINGAVEEALIENRVEDIYRQMQVLFPEIEYNTPSFDDWYYPLKKKIENKFSVITEIWPSDGFLGCYFGYVVGDSYEKISHWGKKTNMRVTLSKNAVINTFWSWYHKIDGLGGWNSTVTSDDNEVRYENKIMLDTKYKSAYAHWEKATNKEKRMELLAKAEANDKDLFDRPVLEVFYSSLLSLKFELKAMDELMGDIRTKFKTEEEIKPYVINHLVYDVFVQLTYIHESQHAIDSNYYNFEPWEKEYRAMMSEPVYGKLQLLDITSQLQPDIGDESTAYGKAHTKIFTDIVNYINEHKEDYPAIDTSKNIMMQLSKLSGNELKNISRSIFEKVYPGQRYGLAIQ